jgi:hypothetical protein
MSRVFSKIMHLHGCLDGLRCGVVVELAICGKQVGVPALEAIRAKGVPLPPAQLNVNPLRVANVIDGECAIPEQLC